MSTDPKISKSTMIRISKDARDIVDNAKNVGESQSDCIQRIFQAYKIEKNRNEYPDEYGGKATYSSGYKLAGFREYSYDRNESHLYRNRQPDFVPMFEVYLTKGEEKRTVLNVTRNDLDLMKQSDNIIVRAVDSWTAAFVALE